MSTIATSTASAQKLRQLHFAFAAVALASLAACGGGGDDSAVAATPSPAPVAAVPTPAPVPAPAPVVVPAPTPVAVTGKVIINQGIKNAMVCMDLNANSLCDTGEPASAATGADGTYTLSYDPSAITALQVAAAPMLAMIGTDAVDAADATAVKTKSYVMMAPAGRPAQINPLTTLVQTGIASGLSMAQSRAAVVVQLGISDADIDDYQANASDPKMFLDNARNMAGLTDLALQAGDKLNVIDIAATSAVGDQLAQFNLTDGNNFFIRTFSSADIAGTGKSLLTDSRRGMTTGRTSTQLELYGAQAYLTPSGWQTCSGSFEGTRGTPSRSTYCGGLPSAGYTISTDISGKLMADVVKSMQAATDGSNTINMNADVLATQTFPAGSSLYKRANANLGQAIYINNLNSTNEVGVAGGVTSLEAFIAARPNSSANLTTGAGMVYTGNAVDTSHWLMASFVDAVSQVQYYSCTFNTAATSITGCVAINTGTYSIKTVNGVRLIAFAGQPANPLSYTTGYAEYKGGVARYRMNAANSSSISQRLNGTAWDAMLKFLNLRG